VKDKLAALALLIVGLMQMTGDLIGWPALKAVGAVTVASPAPKVFSAVRGLETYSTHFFIEWTDRQGRPHSLRLTPEVYARLRGPYNRRNVYGAVLAYGRVLKTDPRSRPMFDAVANYALRGEPPLLRELGIDPKQIAGPVRVRLVPLSGTSIGDLPRIVEVSQP